MKEPKSHSELDLLVLVPVQIEELDAAQIWSPPRTAKIKPKPAATAVLPQLELAQVGLSAEDQTLETYILNNETYKKAQRLRADPRFEQLDQRTRTEFTNEWQALTSGRTGLSRDVLLGESRPFDKERKDLAVETKRLAEEHSGIAATETVLQKDTAEHNKRVGELKRDIDVWGKAVDRHNQNVKALNAEYEVYKANVAQYNAEARDFNSQCADRRLPPGEAARCRNWKGRLDRRYSELEGKRVDLVARAEAIGRETNELNQQKAALETRSAAADKRAAEINKSWGDLQNRKKKYDDDSRKMTERAKSLEQKWGLEKKRIAEWETALGRFNERLEKAEDGISKLQTWTFTSDGADRPAIVQVRPTGPFTSIPDTNKPDPDKVWHVKVPGCEPPFYFLPIRGTFVVDGREVRFTCEGEGCGRGEYARHKTVCEGRGRLDDEEFPRGTRAHGTMKVTVTDPLQIRLITSAGSISDLYEAVKERFSKPEFEQLVRGLSLPQAKAAVEAKVGPRRFDQDWSATRS
jgi:predicted  nucleic acid-binding Zn-ribbon protein